ncbi:MAG: phage tail protein [Candidatus Pacearchaeota archaeon]|nr:phage tail protein [Candidatus Pacearchaeota archaeon]
MKKLQLIRDHLLSGPIKIEPDNLLTYADKGKVKAHAQGTNSHFEFEYNANIIIENFSGQADQITYWVLLWLNQHQPNHGENAFDFQADILNDKNVDLAITLALTETIKVSTDVNGDIVLHHADDPTLEPVLLPATDWTLYVNDDPDPVATWLQNG